MACGAATFCSPATSGYYGSNYGTGTNPGAFRSTNAASGALQLEFRDRHFEAEHTGSLRAVVTFMVGSLKGAGRVNVQSVIDGHCCNASGRSHTSRLPMTPVHVLNEDDLPFSRRT